MSELVTGPAFHPPTPMAVAQPGLRIRLIRPVMVSVLARKNRLPAVMEKARAAFGLHLTDAPVRSSAGTLSALGIGPGRWLFLGAEPAELEPVFAGLVSLSDHSDGYAVFELWGPDVFAVLAKGLPLEIPRFGENDAAVSTIAHIGAIVWKSRTERFAIAVFRSYAGSFWHWLSVSAGEFGFTVENDE